MQIIVVLLVIKRYKMAVDYLSALNSKGSGLNITQLVDSLVQAETAPLSSQIEQKIQIM